MMFYVKSGDFMIMLVVIPFIFLSIIFYLNDLNKVLETRNTMLENNNRILHDNNKILNQKFLNLVATQRGGY